MHLSYKQETEGLETKMQWRQRTFEVDFEYEDGAFEIEYEIDLKDLPVEKQVQVKQLALNADKFELEELFMYKSSLLSVYF